MPELWKLRKRKLGKEEERHSWFLFLIISYFVGSGTQGISLRAVQARHEKCGLTYKAKSRTTKLGKSATIAHLWRAAHLELILANKLPSDKPLWRTFVFCKFRILFQFMHSLFGWHHLHRLYIPVSHSGEFLSKITMFSFFYIPSSARMAVRCLPYC